MPHPQKVAQKMAMFFTINHVILTFLKNPFKP